MHDRAVKRVLDVTLAGAALIAAAPVLALAAAAIKFESRGAVLFQQTRVGQNRAPIQTLKLRTMVAHADRFGPQITADRDPRITRVGRWLRRTKLDELPQLWNVVRGDMSLVGPRPEVPRYVQAYRPEWDRLFSVRPGLTDLASITFRDEERLLAKARDRERAYREIIMPLKLRLALLGVDQSSVGYDLRIIAQTLVAIVRSRTSQDDEILADAERQIERQNHEVSQ